MKRTVLTFVTLAAASVVTSHAAAIHAGLLNYWALDDNANDTAGSLAGNTSSNASNGTIAGP